MGEFQQLFAAHAEAERLGMPVEEVLGALDSRPAVTEEGPTYTRRSLLLGGGRAARRRGARGEALTQPGRAIAAAHRDRGRRTRRCALRTRVVDQPKTYRLNYV
jgi:hypothetical protein